MRGILDKLDCPNTFIACRSERWLCGRHAGQPPMTPPPVFEARILDWAGMRRASDVDVNA